MVEIATVSELLGRWWFNYDEGHFDVLRSLVTEDVAFRSETDTGKTSFEEFVRAECRGREDVMAWQTDHRLGSPYPLRHMGVNIHITRGDDDEAHFSSYLFVTQIVDGQVSNLSTGIATGTVRLEGSVARLSSLKVTLDTQNSVTFKDREHSRPRVS